MTRSYLWQFSSVCEALMWPPGGQHCPARASDASTSGHVGTGTLRSGFMRAGFAREPPGDFDPAVAAALTYWRFVL